MNQIVDELTEAGEKNLVNCSVFLDLAKAFNTVNHEILLSKLKGYKVKGSMLKFNSLFNFGQLPPKFVAKMVFSNIFIH